MTVEPPADDVSVSYDPEADVYRATFESATVEPTVAVVQTMAAAEETDPTDLEPLYDAIDPQALDRICSEGVPARDGDRTVEFTYHGRRVAVRSRGAVEIRPLDDER